MIDLTSFSGIAFLLVVYNVGFLVGYLVHNGKFKRGKERVEFVRDTAIQVQNELANGPDRHVLGKFMDQAELDKNRHYLNGYVVGLNDAYNSIVHDKLPGER